MGEKNRVYLSTAAQQRIELKIEMGQENDQY